MKLLTEGNVLVCFRPRAKITSSFLYIFFSESKMLKMTIPTKMVHVVQPQQQTHISKLYEVVNVLSQLFNYLCCDSFLSVWFKV